MENLYLNAHIKNEDLKLITTLHFKGLEKEKQTKPKASRSKKIINVRAEIHKIENRKTIKKNINKSNHYFLKSSK